MVRERRDPGTIGSLGGAGVGWSWDPVTPGETLPRLRGRAGTHGTNGSPGVVSAGGTAVAIPRLVAAWRWRWHLHGEVCCLAVAVGRRHPSIHLRFLGAIVVAGGGGGAAATATPPTGAHGGTEAAGMAPQATWIGRRSRPRRRRWNVVCAWCRWKQNRVVTVSAGPLAAKGGQGGAPPPGSGRGAAAVAAAAYYGSGGGGEATLGGGGGGGGGSGHAAAGITILTADSVPYVWEHGSVFLDIPSGGIGWRYGLHMGDPPGSRSAERGTHGCW